MARIAFIERNESGSEAFSVAKAMGFEVWYISNNRGKAKLNCRESDLVDRVIEVDTNSVETILHVLSPLVKRGEIQAITTFHEFYTEITAKVCAHFGFPGHSAETGAKVRHKDLMREAFQKAQVPIPRFQKVLTWEAALFAAEEIGFPVILKPTDGAASRGVTLNRDAEELRRNFAELSSQTHDARGRKLSSIKLVEEELRGTKVSVETVSFQGETQICAVTSKLMGPPPNFVELGHAVPAMVSDDEFSQIERVTRAAITALGIENGVSHVELMLTASGPKVIEVGGRLGGDRIGNLVRHALGIDLFRASLELSLGIRPVIKANRQSAAAIRFFTSSEGRLTSIQGAEKARALPFIQELRIKPSVGDFVAGPQSDSGRIGYVIAVGSDSRMAQTQAERAIAQVSFGVLPQAEAG